MLMKFSGYRRSRFSAYDSDSRATSSARGKSPFPSPTSRRVPSRLSPRWPRRRPRPTKTLPRRSKTHPTTRKTASSKMTTMRMWWPPRLRRHYPLSLSLLNKEWPAHCPKRQSYFFFGMNSSVQVTNFFFLFLFRYGVSDLEFGGFAFFFLFSYNRDDLGKWTLIRRFGRLYV